MELWLLLLLAFLILVVTINRKKPTRIWYPSAEAVGQSLANTLVEKANHQKPIAFLSGDSLYAKLIEADPSLIQEHPESSIQIEALAISAFAAEWALESVHGPDIHTIQKSLRKHLRSAITSSVKEDFNTRLANNVQREFEARLKGYRKQVDFQLGLGDQPPEDDLSSVLNYFREARYEGECPEELVAVVQDAILDVFTLSRKRLTQFIDGIERPA